MIKTLMSQDECPAVERYIWDKIQTVYADEIFIGLESFTELELRTLAYLATEQADKIQLGG